MKETSAINPQRRRRRAMGWSVVLILILAMVLPSLGYVMAQTGDQPQPQYFEDVNPRSETWRAVRDDTPGFTAMQGPYVTNTLISNVGQNWRQFRSGPLMFYGGWFLIAVPLLIAAFYLIMGTVKLEHGRAGKTIVRWKGYERLLHWTVATLFIILAITGLSLLFGRTVLIPVFGAEGFSAYAQGAMFVHNFVGPAFSIALLIMIVLWAKDNIPTRVDLEWFKQGGGIVKKTHPPAGKMNGGEKAWFWLGVFGLGLAVSITGLVLDFPIFGQTRDVMAWTQSLHAIAAIFWIGLFFGHVYIGTLGTEGAFEGMARGRSDINWAKQHHDLWYEEQIAKGEVPLTVEEEERAKHDKSVAHQPRHS